MNMQVSSLALGRGTPKVLPLICLCVPEKKNIFSATVEAVELEGKKSFINGGKQEIWRGWRKLHSTQWEMINPSSLQLLGLQGRAVG